MMKPKPKVAVDVDGVLADMHTPCFRLIGLPYTWRDVQVWDFFEELHVDRRTFWEAYKRLWSEKFHLIPLIEEDAPEIIAKLRQRYEVHIMTSRHKETTKGTELWLRHRGIEYDKLIVLPLAADKTKYLDDYLALVDDNPVFAKHSKVILFDRPWNKTVSVNARRIRSLRELLELPVEPPPQRGV
jgi:uncharacterized HAD superfamily protein